MQQLLDFQLQLVDFSMLGQLFYVDQFLDYLGLSSINELPEVKEEIEKRDTETDLYESKYKEN